MGTCEQGKLIAKLRQEAGYTQKSLAEALFVTDKAVSKWERGVCLPDAALLTKLSMLLDADIEYLLAGKNPYGEHRWKGELCVNNVRGMIAGKPLLHYLLSYFMLVGITDIAILTNDTEYVKTLELSKYGLDISYTSDYPEKKMIVYDKFLLFGVNITRQFQQCMSSEGNMALALQGRDLPILFVKENGFTTIEATKKLAGIKTLGRGTIYIPIKEEAELSDASDFVSLYEKYHNNHIADLEEIAKLRGLI